jgi:hypothetical protein
MNGGMLYVATGIDIVVKRIYTVSVTRMGRKPLPKDELKSEILFFRATQEEKAKLESEARKRRIKISLYLRSFIFPQ